MIDYLSATGQAVEKAQESGVASTSQQKKLENAVPEELDRRKIYNLSELEGMGFGIGFLSMNRAIEKKSVNEKAKSIKKIGGVISPCLLVSAKACHRSGHSIRIGDETLAENDPRMEKTLVILDGQHRYEGYLKAKKENPNLELPCYFPQSDGVDIISILRESNVVTKPWKGSDYLVQLILNSASKGIDAEKLIWISDKIHEENFSETAAWYWATLQEKRIPTKAQLSNAMDDEKKLKEFCEKGKFSYGKKIYDRLSKYLDQSIVGRKITPSFFIGKIEKMVENDRTMSNIVDDIVDFIDKKIDARISAKIMEVKKAKDETIKKKLNELYDEYEKEKSTH